MQRIIKNNLSPSKNNEYPLFVIRNSLISLFYHYFIIILSLFYDYLAAVKRFLRKGVSVHPLHSFVFGVAQHQTVVKSEMTLAIICK
jgi:hypothetical protein